MCSGLIFQRGGKFKILELVKEVLSKYFVNEAFAKLWQFFRLTAISHHFTWVDIFCCCHCQERLTSLILGENFRPNFDIFFEFFNLVWTTFLQKVCYIPKCISMQFLKWIQIFAKVGFVLKNDVFNNVQLQIRAAQLFKIYLVKLFLTLFIRGC